MKHTVKLCSFMRNTGTHSNIQSAIFCVVSNGNFSENIGKLFHASTCLSLRCNLTLLPSLFYYLKEYFVFQGRDHGMPTFMDVRRKCGLSSNFQTFDDLIAVFPKENVELLKSVYRSIEDIDLYVGGSKHAFWS
jgi:hypothetical protein